MTKPAQIKAVFLDRDGTINQDPGYISREDQIVLIPGAAAAIRTLRQAGFFVVVISNQSGVARGLIQLENLPLIHERLNELLSREGGSEIDAFEFCTHHPDDGCDCRKPKPKLLLEAATKYSIDLSQSFMVGDRPSDVRAGGAAGCKASVLVRTGEGRESEKKISQGEAAIVVDSMTEAADWILQQSQGSSSAAASS